MILAREREKDEEILSGNGGDMFGFEREWTEVEEHMKKKGKIS